MISPPWRRRSPSRPRSGWRGPSARCGSARAASAPARRPCAPKARPARRRAVGAAGGGFGGGRGGRCRRLRGLGALRVSAAKGIDAAPMEAHASTRESRRQRIRRILIGAIRRAAVHAAPPRRRWLRGGRRARYSGALITTETSRCDAAPSSCRPAGPPRWPLPAIGLAQALEKPKLTIAVGGKNLLYYLPLTIAETQGYFKAEGLDVTIADFAGGSRALQALVGGSADVTSGAFEHTINMQVKGQRLRAFVLQGRAPQIVLGVNPKTMPSYKSLGRSQGQEARRHGAGLVDPGARQLRARQGGAEAERRVDHRRRRRQRRGRGDALRPDRRDLQPRPGDHPAARARAT